METNEAILKRWTVNQRLQVAGIDHSIGLQGLTEGFLKDVMKLMREAEADLIRTLEYRLTRAGRKGFDPGPWTTSRARSMLAEVRKVNQEAYKAFHGTLQDSLFDLALLEGEFQAQTIQKFLPFEWSLTRFSKAQIEAIIRDLPLAGKNMVQTVSALAQSRFDAIAREVALGLTEGETIPQMVQRVKGTTRAVVPRPGVLNVHRRHAETHVRTAVTHVAAAARDRLYRENQDLIKGVEYVATLDARTTLICASLDGEIFAVGQGPRPPQHYRCRSTTVPVLRPYWELGVDGKTLTPGGRASMDGRLPSKTTFESWIQGKKVDDPKFFRRYFGYGRARILEANPNLKVSDLLTKSRNTLTIKELSRIEGVVIPRDVRAMMKSLGMPL